MAMHPDTVVMLGLTNQPYDKYNVVLSKIKELLAEPERIEAFETTLAQELPLTTARRAYRTAIKVSMGEKAIREWQPPVEKHSNKPKK